MNIRRKNGNNWEKKNEDRNEYENEMGSTKIGRIRRESIGRKRMRKKKRILKKEKLRK
jgi:hypothetical protein